MKKMAKALCRSVKKDIDAAKGNGKKVRAVVIGWAGALGKSERQVWRMYASAKKP